MSWEKVKISDFTSVITGGTPSTTKTEYWENGNIPWLNSGALNQEIITSSENFITQAGMENSSTRMMPKDTILIALTGTTTGVVGYLSIEACANQSVTGILPSPKHHPKFLYYYLKSIRAQILEASYGGAQKHISQAFVKELLIPLPPLSTQKRIADILDTADALRRKDQELLTKYDQLAQAIFIDMFGDPVKNEKGWEVKKGEYLLEVIGGAAFKSSDYLNEGIPLIRIGTVNKGFFDENQLVYLPEYFKESFSKYLIYPGDLLMTLTGTVGKDDYGNVFIMTDKYESCLLNQRVAKLKIIEKLLNPRYLEYILKQKEIKAELTGVSRGVRQANISNSDIYTLNIIAPPIELQNEFAQRIKLLEIQKNIQQNSHSTSLFASLIQQAFNGTLVS
jgi:type I restriction enzyme S subunit